jgi:hypothetical protein
LTRVRTRIRVRVKVRVRVRVRVKVKVRVSVRVSVRVPVNGIILWTGTVHSYKVVLFSCVVLCCLVLGVLRLALSSALSCLAIVLSCLIL